MTTVRDYGASALPPPAMADPTSHRRSAPTSPSVHGRDDRNLDRRGSTVSRKSTNSSIEGLRHRRANTVTSYVEADHPEWQPGAEPGIDTKTEDDNLPQHLANLKAQCEINIIDFSDDDFRHCRADNYNLANFLEEPRPDDMSCRWISVNGLSWDVIKCLGNKYNLHRLAIEDLIHTHTRTKVDWYADHAFVVLTLQKLVRIHQHRGQNQKCDCAATEDYEMDEKLEHEHQRPQSKRRWWQRAKQKKTDVLPRYLDTNGDGKIDEFVPAHSGLSEDSPIKPIRTLHRYESAQIPEHTAFMEKHSALAEEDLAVSVEQVSLFLLADNMVLSFFEHSAEDVESPILERLQSTETMLRRSCDASLMLQAIIDAIVDLAVPVKDAYNKARKELQVDAMTSPNIRTSRALHIFGEEIDMLQNLFKPIVHLVNALRDHNNEPLYPAFPISQQAYGENSDPHPKPSGKTGRDLQGMPKFVRKVSEYKRATLKRTDTATSVSITPLAHTYFGDVLDHAITMIQAFEQMDASANNISTLVFNTVGAKTNNFLMILAVVTVFFAPLTFITGYFGQNFSSGAGLAHPFSFFFVVAVPSVVGFMALVFAYMFRDWFKDVLAKRGFKLHRRRHRRPTRS